MKFATLTRPDGKAVYVNPAAVYFVMDAVAGPEGAKTQLIHSGGQIFVKEASHDIAALLEVLGGG